jgi:hypothetical protein
LMLLSSRNILTWSRCSTFVHIVCIDLPDSTTSYSRRVHFMCLVYLNKTNVGKMGPGVA